MSFNDPNLVFLKPDEFLKQYPALPTAQLFVDLWNAREWYARDFSNKLFEIIKSKTEGWNLPNPTRFPN